MDADQNVQISTLIYANILGNSESATMRTATEYTLREQCAKDPHKYNSMHYHSRKQTSFITPTALQTLPLKISLRKLPVPLTLLTLPAPILVPTLIPRTPQYYHQKEQPIAKTEPNTDDKFSFLFEKRMNLQHQLDNTGGANGSSKRRKQVYWGKTRINQ